MVAISGRGGGGDAVVDVNNDEIGVPSQASRADAAIGDGKPEIADPAIDLFDLCVSCPEGRVLGRLSLNTHDREVLCVDPDLAAIEKLALHERLNRKNVARPAWCLFVPQHRKSVVILVERYATLILCVERLLFTLQQLLKYSLNAH